MQDAQSALVATADQDLRHGPVLLQQGVHLSSEADLFCHKIMVEPGLMENEFTLSVSSTLFLPGDLGGHGGERRLCFA